MNALRSRLSAIARRRSGLSNGGLLRVDDQVAADIGRRHLADRLRRLLLDVLQQTEPSCHKARTCRTCRR